MVEIVKLDAYREAPPDSPAASVEDEQFLIKEGLELLSAYRSIADTEIRLAVLALVKSLGTESA